MCYEAQIELEECGYSTIRASDMGISALDVHSVVLFNFKKDTLYDAHYAFNKKFFDQQRSTITDNQIAVLAKVQNLAIENLLFLPHGWNDETLLLLQRIKIFAGLKNLTWVKESVLREDGGQGRQTACAARAMLGFGGQGGESYVCPDRKRSLPVERLSQSASDESFGHCWL